MVDLQMRIDTSALGRVTGQHELAVARRVAFLQQVVRVRAYNYRRVHSV